MYKSNSKFKLLMIRDKSRRYYQIKILRVDNIYGIIFSLWNYGYIKNKQQYKIFYLYQIYYNFVLVLIKANIIITSNKVIGLVLPRIKKFMEFSLNEIFLNHNITSSKFTNHSFHQ